MYKDIFNRVGEMCIQEYMQQVQQGCRQVGQGRQVEQAEQRSWVEQHRPQRVVGSHSHGGGDDDGGTHRACWHGLPYQGCA